MEKKSTEVSRNFLCAVMLTVLFIFSGCKNPQVDTPKDTTITTSETKKKLIDLSLLTDANLRAAIATRLGIAENALGSHTVDELTDLNAQNSNGVTIYTLAGLSQFTSLRDLQIFSQPVTTLSPLFGMASIKYLNIQGTNLNSAAIMEITPAHFPAIDSIWLDDWHDMDLKSHLTEIITCYSALPNLTSLGLVHFAIDDARFTTLYNMVLAGRTDKFDNLSLTDNPITNASLVQIAKLTDLQALNISNTQISELTSLSSCSSMKNFTLRTTKVTDLSPLLAMYNAGSFHNSGSNIDVNDNNLDLRTGSANRTVIDTLVSKGISVSYTQGNLTSNPLINLSLITDANLRARIATQLGVEESTLGSHNVTELTELITSNTGGSPIYSLSGLSQFTSLNNINIFGQPVTTLSPLYGMASIHNLDLQGSSLNYSAIAGITPENFPSLGGLWLGDTANSDIESHFTEIVSLFSKLSKVSGLGLGGFQMTDAQFTTLYNTLMAVKLDKFSSLSLSDNLLTNATLIRISNLTTLKFLNISNTQISDLMCLSTCASMNSLTLRTTQVTDLSPLLAMYNAGSFHNSGSSIDVSNNNLDLRAGSANRTVIDTLVSKGVTVSYTQGNTVN